MQWPLSTFVIIMVIYVDANSLEVFLTHIHSRALHAPASNGAGRQDAERSRCGKKNLWSLQRVHEVRCCGGPLL